MKPTRVTNAIRSLRFTHGEMTQAELAHRIGVTRQTVIAIEHGRYSPSLEMAFQIAGCSTWPSTTCSSTPTYQEKAHEGAIRYLEAGHPGGKIVITV